MYKEKITKETFVKALKGKKKLLLTYFSGEYSLFLTKLCVPIQHSKPIAEFENDNYFFWDEQADIGDRLFGLPLSDIAYMELTDESYNPDDYIVTNLSDA